MGDCSFVPSFFKDNKYTPKPWSLDLQQCSTLRATQRLPLHDLPISYTLHEVQPAARISPRTDLQGVNLRNVTTL